MKIKNLILPCLISLGLCSCNLFTKHVSDVSVKIEQKVRETGQNFDVNDIKAFLQYGENDTKEVSFKNFGINNLSASCTKPDGSKIAAILNDFPLDMEGTYTIDVAYNPSSRYSFPFSGSDTFDVELKIIPATSLTLSSNSLSLKEGSSQLIEYSILPNDCTTTVPTFESNDINVATVDEDGNVRAINEGQCIIKAQVDDIVQECLITVSPSSTIDFVFDSNKFTTSLGDWGYSLEGTTFDSRQNRGVCMNEETTIQSPTSLDGVTAIEFECFSGSSGSFYTTSSSSGSIEIYVGDVLIRTCKINGYNSSLKNMFSINYLSGDVKFVIKPDKANIYLRSISITYDENSIYPTSISLLGNDTLGIGENNKLSISYTPVSTSQRIIEWSSSNEDVLTVGRDGTIVGVSKGTAVVTAKAKTEEGFVSSSFSVNVIKILVESIELNAEELEVYEGKNKTLVATINPTNASNKSVTFESSNPNVATVDNSGVVTGIGIGTCTITCISKDDSTIVKTCQVSVLKQPTLVANSMSLNLKDYIYNNYYSTDCAPSLGTLKLLVIPVWFTDSSTYISLRENVRSDIQKVYFGDSSDTGWESVKTFYEKESGGKLTFTGTVSDWYECGKSLSTYNYDSGSSSTATSTLVKNATDWYFNNYTSDSRLNYDNDSDGYLDGVVLIYGAPDYSAFEAKMSIYSAASYKDNLWAYTFWLQNRNYKNTSSPGPNSFFWASYDFMYGSTNAKTRTGKSDYSSGVFNTHLNLDPHTFIHEMGHIFGLEDYYDYSGFYKPAGGFSMQDYNVGGHDPFSCLALGWAKAFVPIESCEITLNPFQNSHEVILLSPSFNSYNSPFDEYLLIELYTPTGLNKFDTDYQYSYQSPRGVNATGIRLWHVDARLIKYSARGTPITSTTYNHPIDGCKFMMSNTYYSSSTSEYISPCGKSYANYNMLQLIRNSTSATYQPTDYLKEAYLFRNGSTFNMQNYKKQFVNSGKLNSGEMLGWNFSVSLSGTNDSAVATITLIKE